MDNRVAILKDRYGLERMNVIPQQGGWAALAYRAFDGERTFFLKAYEKSRASTPKWTALIDAYAPILVWLARHTGLSGNVPVPIPTESGAFRCEDDQAVYMLYEYIAGETVGGKPLTGGQIRRLAEIVAELHRYGERIPVDTDAVKERFDVPFLKPLRRLLHEPSDRMPTDVGALLEPFARSVGRLADTVEELSGRLKAGSPRMALCHTDIHRWNMMQTDRELILVDWEGLKLAPVEADLTFIAEEPYADDFMAVYREVHPDYEPNADAMRFYRGRRKLEDIWEFAEQLLYDDPDASGREAAMDGLTKELNGLDEA
ncbi:phosphotransferase enzyme family protein [Paenibacillus flagellatus]|uniref:Kinase n=1 Tax=Paenibacillus flagellatus TaxID=2211139 RepID=A0A2V5KBC8_9BACL|nr:aminoglycoside phosphotransferase family protein [Paenibacillus flagellatus]PYI55273.1 kinase [Paenibacillus flagellatus]